LVPNWGEIGPGPFSYSKGLKGKNQEGSFLNFGGYFSLGIGLAYLILAKKVLEGSSF